MAYSNGVISGAVGMGDISQALGLSSLDLGTLASYAYQNKWAKYKPFVYPAWGFASSAAELAARRSKNCGLVMKDYGNNVTLYAAMVAAGDGAAGWLHDTPQGGSSSPFRMLDFLGYDNSMAAPFQFSIYPNPAYMSDSPHIGDDGGAGVSEIEIADLLGNGTAALNHSGYSYFNIQNLNVGVMYGTSNTVPLSAYTIGTISGGTVMTQIPKPSATGNYYAVPFLSDQTFYGAASSTDGIFIPLPIGMKIWRYYNYLPFADNGSYQYSVDIHIKLRVLRSLSGYALKYQLSKNGSWSSVQDMYDARTWYAGDTIDFFVRTVPAGYGAPEMFRLVWGNITDTRNYPFATSPTD